MTEMRKDRRAPVSLKVKFKSATVDEFIEQFGTDVSRGGIFIKTKKPLGLGALLKFEFQLQGGQAVLHGVGRVAWRRLAVHIEEQARPELPLGMGIKFIKLDEPSRAVLERIESSHELNGRLGSRFDQSDVAEIAPPLSSLPPPIALSPPPASRLSTEGRNHATPLVPGSMSPMSTGDPGRGAATNGHARAVRAGQSSPASSPTLGQRPSGGLSTTFRPPPPARDSVPPLHANAPGFPAISGASSARAALGGQMPMASATGAAASMSTASTASTAARTAPKRSPSKAVAPAVPPARPAMPNVPGMPGIPGLGAGRRPAVPGAAPRSAARDTSEFLASAFSVGGVGQEVRSQAQAQAERARHDPQSVDLANELFGDLSDAASNASARERADDSALAELPGAHVEPKPLSAEERLLAEKIPSIEDLVNETGQTGSHPPVSMGPRAPRASRAPSALAAPAAAGAIKVGAKPSLQPGAASVRPRVSLAPNEPRLSLELGPGSLNIASEAPRSVGRKRRGIVPILLGTLVVAGAAAGAYVFLGPGLGRVPSASAVPPEAHAAAAAEPAAVNPSANQAAPAANAAPVAADPQAQAIEVPLPVSTTPPGAEVVVDGQVAGTTPTTVKLHGGATVELSVRLHGYVSKTERITVAAGLAPRDISLQPMPYVLAVTTEPAGATVTVGSQSAEAPAPLELEHVEGAVQVNIQMQGYAPVTRSLRGEDFHEHEGVLRAEFTLKLTPQPASAARRKVPAARVARTLEPPAPGEAAPINTAPPEPTHVAPEPEAAPSPAAPAPPSEPVNAAPPASAAPPAEPKQPAAEPAPAAAAPAPAAPAAEPAAQ